MESCRPRGSDSSPSSRGGRWKIWRCWQGDQEQAGGTTPSLPKKFSALLEAIPVPITARDSPITAERKPSSRFSPVPCLCRCRALCFRVEPSWFWKDYRQFLSRSMHMQSYFRKMMLGALWVNPDTENAP